MATVTYATDSTTLVLNGYVFNNLIVGDTMELAPVNDATTQTDSANGVSISARADKDAHTLTVRVQKNTPDDVFLNSARNTQAPTVLNGSLKENFALDGEGGIDNVTLEGGSITTQPKSVKNNLEGNPTHEYVIRFRYAIRSL